MKLKLGNSEVVKAITSFHILIKLKKKYAFIWKFGDINFKLKEIKQFTSIESVRTDNTSSWTDSFSKMSNME